MADSTPLEQSSSPGWGRKLGAVLALLAASLAFVVTVLAPLVLPFIPAEYLVPPSIETIIDSFDDSPADRHRY